MKLVRYAAALCALGVLTGSVVLTLDRLLQPSGRLWVLLVSFTPYGVLGHGVALLMLLMARRSATRRLRVLTGGAAVVAALGLALHVAWLAPAYVGEHATGKPDLVVLNLNLRFGEADPAALLRLAREVRADVILLEEVTPTALAGLSGEGLGTARTPWRHVGGQPRAGVTGTMVFSRYPLTPERSLPIPTGAYRMRVEAPEPFKLTAAHTTQPYHDTSGWRRDLRVLRADAAGVSGARIMAGDFNATLDHRPMRALLGTGLADAAVQANSGWQPTWPVPDSRRGTRLNSPVTAVTIDHVLGSRAFSAVWTRTYRVPGSDHLALVAGFARR